MGRLLKRVYACIVLSVITIFLFNTTVVSEERSSVETDYEEQQQTQENEEVEEE